MISDKWNIQLELWLLSLCTKYTWFVFLLGFVFILISLSLSLYLFDKDEMMMLKLRRLTFRKAGIEVTAVGIGKDSLLSSPTSLVRLPSFGGFP